MSLSKPRVIVGLDFGTTFSGFAFSHISNLDKIFCCYEYRRTGGEKPYCKTLTASYYKEVNGVWEFRNWGYPARAEYERDVSEQNRKHAPPFKPTVGTYFSKFKLHLAPSHMGPSTAQPLPPGITVSVLITDYLHAMGELILKTLRTSYGPHFPGKEIQWCVTVPSIWDNVAKETMKRCMADAGLVNGPEGSSHPLTVVLEPEAASFHCHTVMTEQNLVVGDKLLVADIGGGTADVVMQEVVSVEKLSRKAGDEEKVVVRVKEITVSSGDLCGGTYVDVRFIEFLHSKIGPCLQECIVKEPKTYGNLIKAWETHKVSFGDPGVGADIQLPGRVVQEWEQYDIRMGNPCREKYDELEVTYEEMQSIFDPVVEHNLELIHNQLQQVEGVKVLAVVGGFAGSPYLMARIEARFAGRVLQIISPPDPGSAVCQGAVALALHPNTIDSRISRKTYGFEVAEPFELFSDPPELGERYDGMLKCNKRFKLHVRKGDHVKPDESISHVYGPRKGQTAMDFRLYSSEEQDPRYVVGDGMKLEGTIVVDISGDMKLETERRLKVSLYFGRSSIEVVAEGLNFSAARSGTLSTTSAFE